MDIDTYQPIEAVEPPKRVRRPWWRWNLITLAVVLFVLLWTRELFQFAPSLTWLAAMTVFFLWAVAPLPFTERSLMSMEERPRRKSLFRGGFGSVCRVLALLLLVASVLSFLYHLYWLSTQMVQLRRPNQFFYWQIFAGIGQQLYYLATAAILWAVAAVSEKLDGLVAKQEGPARETDEAPSEVGLD